jgi:hypothetical protein
MASSVSTDRLACRRKIEMWDHDPDSTAARIVSPDANTTKRYVAMAGYGSFQVAAMSATLTGNGITLLEIVAAEDSAGTNATQIKTSGTIAADAVGDWAMLEATADEINHVGKAAGYDFTHVGARLTLANAADECAVVYIRDEPLFKYDALTPATTIA